MSTPAAEVQLGFEGMPTRLYPATPSRLTTFLDCPRRYRMAYLDRPTPPRGAPWAHNSVGAAVHTALARWWDLPERSRTPEAGGMLLVRGWLTDGFRDGRQSLDARERAREYVERYLTDVDPAVRPIGVERTVSLRTARAALWGRADRIDDRPGEGVVVVDYKTGRSVLTVDDARASMALAVYAAATARTLRRACTRVELHHLPTGDVVAWDHTDESLEQQLRRADDLAAELGVLDSAYDAGLSRVEADEAFPAHVGPRCGWCDFRSSCRPGQSVPPHKSWDGIDD
ncbi:MAG TPA: PD-(D/E)XK nuclease family protein [Nocardioides sp.]|uniref:RecB family exonuclease n=1 Tax=Nocardioides sp. TaxID=35761 RepID=UPI002D80ED9F|nr:PD-(D/E)XK nuclease family protein [Nocardioides sp.]HET6652837.1 PD-(D/E)XK nuclease family protein [Nocardioides sp.]